METYGAGNAPRHDWFYESLHDAVQRGIIIINVSQCDAGSVQMGRYETSLNLLKAGVISGYDLTSEAAVTKLMFLLGQNLSHNEIKELMQTPICGELTLG